MHSKRYLSKQLVTISGDEGVRDRSCTELSGVAALPWMQHAWLGQMQWLPGTWP